MPELNWKHHTLIQALLSRGPLKEEEFHSIFRSLTGKSPGSHRQILNDYLLRINKELAYVQFELRGCRNQYDGMVYYGVVNNVADEQSKLGTKYSVPQIAFYKAIVEAIVHEETGQGTISNLAALNLRLENQVQTGSQSQGGLPHIPPALKNFSMSQKEKTIDELVRDQWLCSTPDGIIGLGIRSFLDLRFWFRNNDIPSCDICNEAGVKAELCQNGSCTIRIHRYCIRKKFSQKRAERVCPGCGAAWKNLVSNVDGVEEVHEEIGLTQSEPSSSGPSMQKRLRSCKREETDTVGAGLSQTTSCATDMRRTTRSSSRQR
uniref:Non-structural maintenance of chromosomes element 1 homolog n=1 Tax=Nelumbo nucifera TaxID=4432 RepID=A0A822YF19_NELNU|nr:TPA_asm: hypothetical protein HUJ06_011615 [Nelumbo nucifera]